MKSLFILVAPLALALGATTGPGSASAPAAATSPQPAQAKARVTYVSTTHNVDYSLRDPEQLFITLRVLPDPGARIAYVDPVVWASHAIDERPNALAPGIENLPLPKALPEITESAGEPGEQFVRVLLQVPPREEKLGRRIIRAEGVIPAAVIRTTEQFHIDIPGKTSHTFQSGVTAVFQATLPRERFCQMDCTFEVPAKLALVQQDACARCIDILNPAFTGTSEQWTAGGSPCQRNGTHITKQFVAWTREGTHPPTGADLALVVETTSAVIPFHIEDVPLP